jgi:hypothetical protein
LASSLAPAAAAVPVWLLVPVVTAPKVKVGLFLVCWWGAGGLPTLNAKLKGVVPPAAVAGAPLHAWMLDDKGFPKATSPLESCLYGPKGAVLLLGPVNGGKAVSEKTTERQKYRLAVIDGQARGPFEVTLKARACWLYTLAYHFAGRQSI